jgi:hypothetical protein
MYIFIYIYIGSMTKRSLSYLFNIHVDILLDHESCILNNDDDYDSYDDDNNNDSINNDDCDDGVCLKKS